MYHPLEEKSPPVGGFSLSVAVYVVKARTRKFKCKKKCENRRKIKLFQHKMPDFVDLLSGFEPETSSLPTAWKPGNYWYSEVFRSFASERLKICIVVN